jgi:hypothetical protein
MDYMSHTHTLAGVPRLNQYAVRGHFGWRPHGLRWP